VSTEFVWDGMNPNRSRRRWSVWGLLVVMGCGGTPIVAPPVPVKVVTVPVHVPCTKSAPPAWVKVGAPVECKPDTVCMPKERFAVYLDDMEALRTWAKNTWVLCAPTEIK
jgi:hypothetical protein